MDKQQVVDSLIANEALGWEESDREELMKMDEGVLNKMYAPKKGKKAPPKEEEEEEVVENTAPATPAKAKVPTVKEYIDAAPEGLREVLTNSMAVHEAEKVKCIDTIVANKKNKFTKEFLTTKSLQELQGMAALAAEAPVANGTPAMFYGGQATPAGTPVANGKEEEGLALPVMNFEKK